MITQLKIENFGLIDDLSLDFSGKLNILTGETGAGKSIIIDALRYALGDQLNPAQIRNSELVCRVEAVFELLDEELRENKLFKEYLLDNETSLIINRSYSPDGRKKIRVNGFSITVSELKELGNHLVDFHGPNDHQMLLSPESHLIFLDRLTDLSSYKAEYSRQYHEFRQALAKLQQLTDAAASREQDADLLTHQIRELEQLPLDTLRYEQLIQEQNRLNNVEKLYESVTQLIAIFENDDTAITRVLTQAFVLLKTLNRIDGTTEKFTGSLYFIQENTNQLLSELRNYSEGLSFQPQEAQEINRKCDIYYDIIRKYGPGLEDAQKFYESAKAKYELLANLEHNDVLLREKIGGIEKDLNRIAEKITRQRKKTAFLLEETIEQELKELGITHVQFECRIEKTELNPDGRDRVSFYISPNAGEALKPLSEIVSSGEAARLMLALKKALTKVDPIPVLIFDEIDAQIGGRLGTIIGRKLQEIAHHRQVILITHLPQIASFADEHFRVYKRVKDNRTVTIVEPLDSEARIKEMAKMMSGEKESNISIAHAHDMLARARLK